MIVRADINISFVSRSSLAEAWLWHPTRASFRTGAAPPPSPHFVQYNVTVEGISKTGQRTPGDNMLQLTMPAGLRLTQAKATGYTTGTATARALPSDAFTKVRAEGKHWKVLCLACEETEQSTSTVGCILPAVRVHRDKSQVHRAAMPSADLYEQGTQRSADWAGARNQGQCLVGGPAILCDM